MLTQERHCSFRTKDKIKLFESSALQCIFTTATLQTFSVVVTFDSTLAKTGLDWFRNKIFGDDLSHETNTSSKMFILKLSSTIDTTKI